MRKYLITVLLFLMAVPCFSETTKSTRIYEKDYNVSWCNAHHGQMEFPTIDGSRVDCLLPNYAVEAERAYKWKEAVGQALFYGIQTKREPAILLIVENKDKEQKYVDRLNVVAEKYGIKVWYITPNELEKDFNFKKGVNTIL